MKAPSEHERTNMTDTVARHACRTCGGTGKTWSLRSWFTDDGYRSSTCGICGGIGLSTYRDAPEYIRFQANARAALTKALEPST